MWYLKVVEHSIKIRLRAPRLAVLFKFGTQRFEPQAGVVVFFDFAHVVYGRNPKLDECV